MEEAVRDTPVMRQFTKLGVLEEIPDEAIILNFRRLLKKHRLAAAMFKQIDAHLARKGTSLRSGSIVWITESG